jgi:hypothetical protein
MITVARLIEAAKSGPSADVPVTSILEGTGLNTAPALRIQSDGLGFYKNTKTESSTIQAIGAWVLDMYTTKGSGRTMLLDLRDAVAGSAPGAGNPVAPFAYQQLKVRLIARCNVYNVSMLNMSGVGSNLVCPLAVEFGYGTGTYRLVMNSDNFSETQPASVTCMAVVDPSRPATAQCKQWKIEPLMLQPDGQKKNVAKLLKLGGSPNQADQNLGDFYISFAIDVTNP